MVFELTWHKRGACLHAGIVQEANLSMVHLASNKASEQHTLWQVLNLHKPVYAVVHYLSCTHLQLTASTETFDVHACIHPIRCRSSPRMVFSYLSLAVHREKKSCFCQSNTFVLENKNMSMYFSRQNKNFRFL